MESQSSFLSLPAELRDRIYDTCFDHAEQATLGSRPEEPPLLRVCETICAEATPIYYSKLTLRFQTYIKRDYDGRTWASTKTWHHSVPDDALRHIKSFRIAYGLVQRRTKEVVALEFLIKLKRRENSFDVGLVIDPSRDRIMSYLAPTNGIMGRAAPGFDRIVCVNFGAVVDKLREHLEGVLRVLAEDPGIGNLGADELDRLIVIDPEALRLQTSV